MVETAMAQLGDAGIPKCLSKDWRKAAAILGRREDRLTDRPTDQLGNVQILPKGHTKRNVLGRGSAPPRPAVASSVSQDRQGHRDVRT